MVWGKSIKTLNSCCGNAMSPLIFFNLPRSSHSSPPRLPRSPPPLLTLYHITLNTHKSTELPRLHTQTWRSLSLSLSLPHSDRALQPPSPLPSHTVCLKKNKPVEKTTKDKKQQQAFGIAGSLSFSFLLCTKGRVPHKFWARPLPFL